MVFAAFVSLGQIISSLAGLLLLILVWTVTRQLPAPKVWGMVKRLRIFFISLFIMYLWFTPGQLIWPVLDRWSPTLEGLAQALERIGALVLLVFAVESLLRLLNRSELLTGLYFMATPLQCMGVNRERFIVRVLLTLEAVKSPSFQQTDTPGQMPAFKLRQLNQYTRQVSQQLVDKIIELENQSMNMREVAFAIIPLPHWSQWLIPLLIITLFVGLNLQF